jgi:hypothetical protein
MLPCTGSYDSSQTGTIRRLMKDLNTDLISATTPPAG